MERPSSWAADMAAMDAALPRERSNSESGDDASDDSCPEPIDTPRTKSYKSYKTVTYHPFRLDIACSSTTQPSIKYQPLANK